MPRCDLWSGVKLLVAYTKNSLLLDFRRGAQRVSPVSVGVLLGSHGQGASKQPILNTRPRRPYPLLLRCKVQLQSDDGITLNLWAVIEDPSTWFGV